LTSRYTERVELVMGLILILVILYAPLGFVGFINFVKQKFVKAADDLKRVED
jgi:hypothetical protein